MDISEAMLRYQLVPKADATLGTYLRESALACAQTTAQSFGCNLEHSAHTGEIACQIFDKLKKVHGVDSSKRLILELASTLHSCGSFVNVRQHNQCTFDLIKGMDIFGLRQREVLETAFVAGSISNNLTPRKTQTLPGCPWRSALSSPSWRPSSGWRTRWTSPHRHKLRDLKIHLEDDQVLFKAKAAENTLLERWGLCGIGPVF